MIMSINKMMNDKNNSNINEFNEKIIRKLVEEINIKSLNNVHLSEADEFEWPNIDNCENSSTVSCLGGKTQLAVLSTGDVVLCCLDYSGKTKIGNLNEQTFRDILMGEKYQLAMQRFQAGCAYFALCQKCKYRNRFK